MADDETVNRGRGGGRTHKTPAVRRWLARRPRYQLHFTPTGASWLNLVECWFAALTDKQLRRGVHRSTRELEAAITTYLAHVQRTAEALRLDQDN